MKFETKVIHSGVHPDPSSGAIMTPIFQTSTYVQDAPGIHKGYEYARTQNPTRSALEENLASLENGQDAICFSSGLAALDALLKLFKPGDKIISSNDLYGGSYRQMLRVFGKYGLNFVFVDMSDVNNIVAEMDENVKLLYIETPTNPMLNIVDIKAITDLVVGKQILTCVDNTFASPYLQNPIDLGADIVLHSATKYLGGHSDVVHGALVCKASSVAEQLRFLQNAVGAVPGPLDCFLILRGIKTLHLRMERACYNARIIAERLMDNDKINKVYYPGFSHHKNHDVAKKQMRDFGAMISFDLKNDSINEAHKILSNTHLFSLAESLGGVESLIGHPSSMTHASIPKPERLKVGLTDSLIRLSVGIEHVEDLWVDLESAMD